MAQNLVKEGHKLIVYDTVPSAVDDVVSAGATKAASPAEVAQQAKTVVTMLPAGAHVRECYTGSDGIFRSATHIHTNICTYIHTYIPPSYLLPLPLSSQYSTKGDSPD